MAYNDRQSHSGSTPQSIPLQDLSRPPDEENSSWGAGMGRRGSGPRARTLLGNNRSSLSGRRSNGRYEQILAGPSIEVTDTDRRRVAPHITTPRSSHLPGPAFDDGEMSPVNVGDFQAAMGGLGFDDHLSHSPHHSPHHSPSPSGSDRSYLGPIMENEGAVTPEAHIGPEAEEYFSGQADDRSPLTDARYLQPISGSSLPQPVGQNHDLSSRSSRSRYSGGMLGSDLGGGSPVHSARKSINGLSQLSIPSMSRSLSTSNSPLNSASSMLRKMSQRVVNLSNEPEMDAQELRRQHSVKMATLDAPPSFPAMTEYAHDEQSDSPQSPEKGSHPGSFQAGKSKWQSSTNPLRGISLGVFSADNKLRLWLCEVLVHPITEPLILVLILLQTILLAIEAAPTITLDGDIQRVGWWDWNNNRFGLVFFVLFVLYTIELVARIIVSGLVINPIEYSTKSPGTGFLKAARERFETLLGAQTGSKSRHDKQAGSGLAPDGQVSILRSFTSIQNQPEQRGHGRAAQRFRLARRAFLRHSFNRLDLLAVSSYWIASILSILDVQRPQQFYLFQMLACMRILRLLSLTSGTSVILRSLKKAAPLLVHVAFLIGFFWLLFAVIGVQTFKASFRRSCVFIGEQNVTDLLSRPEGAERKNLYDSEFNETAFNLNDANGVIQFCGGFLVPGAGLTESRYLLSNFDLSESSPKGYRCPKGSICYENTYTPFGNTVSFDNIINSLEMVFVIMSSNTWSNFLYWTTDSDSMTASFYFVLGIIILSFWLINLLVAVITSSFQVIREESRTSAFTTDEQPLSVEEDEKPNQKRPMLRRVYDKSYWFWIAVIVVSLVIQSLATATTTDRRENLLSNLELVITMVLFLEMVFRFVADWRNFYRSARNWVDLALAVITTVMQIPVIRQSRAYDWLTVFQILRAYRVVLAIPMVRELVVQVLGNVSGILNLIIFVFLVTFLAAIFAVQLLRGRIPQEDDGGDDIRITFGDIWNSFLGMYQVLSSEDWTSIIFTATQHENAQKTAWISALFFILWFTFANFVILNMFIAVIQENFDVSEDEKRLHQVKAFLQQKELSGSTHSNLSLSSIFRFGREKTRNKDPIDDGPATIGMFKDTVVRDFLDEQMEALDEMGTGEEGPTLDNNDEVRTGFLTSIWNRVKRTLWNGEPNPFYSDLLSRPYQDLDARSMVKEIASAAEQRKKAQRQYLKNHPRYNVSLFIFTPRNPIRKLCQQMVGPGRGSKRIEGVDPVKSMWYSFSIFIYACIVAMVLIACIATPLYQREYFIQQGGISFRNWFVWTDLAFAAIFTIEALIKIIADGLFWTPNAYFRGSWGLIDGIVLLTLWISVAAALVELGDIARTVGAFKALRALRLLNVSDSARNTFHSVIILGGWKVISAMFVSISLLVPFAIYGLNLFKGRFMECNDGDIFSITNECVGEYMSSPYNWDVLAPRVAANPYYSFDNFVDSFFILFQIVSQEGWTDTMWSAINARDPLIQPEMNASRGNAVFFIAFNLLGAVFVLTLFVSVFMRNYTEQTGVAFLTAEQRSWLELRKLLRQISPSKRPSHQSAQPTWKNRIYRAAVSKHGTWSRMITGILVLHLVLLMTEFYPDNTTWDLIRNALFTFFVVLYIINIVIRITGLTWDRFRRSSWDLFSLLSVAGTVVLTILDYAKPNDATITQLQRIFLVSIALLLIPRNDQLDQLFKTAAASFNAIANLLLTWFVLFLVWAIALTQTLGLTRFGAMSLANLNLRTVPNALVLLFRSSVGEGWNEIMEDFSNAKQPNCIAKPGDFYNSDCGSAPWARFLFVTWNIISMYIFTSMFVSLIFESFSYVYQQSGGSNTLSRAEIRRFKQAWATYDPNGSGYISKEAFPKFLGELSGVFQMRIYEGEHSVNEIIADCQTDLQGTEPISGVVAGIDIAKLNKRLSTINVTEIRRRRERLNLFSQEVLVSADPDRGIAFSSCLMILAHHNLINDSKSLRLEEFLRRRYRLQRVQEEVQRRVVTGFFDTLYWSRRFARRKDLRGSARMITVPDFAVPEIYVDDMEGNTPRAEAFSPDVHGPPSPRTPQGKSPGFGNFGLGSPQGQVSPTSPLHGPSNSTSSTTQMSPGLSPTSRPRPRAATDTSPSSPLHSGDGISDTNHARRPSDLSQGGSSSLEARSPQSTRHRRQQSSVNSARTMTPMQAFDSSAWGESIRRSFTVRQSPAHGRSGGQSRIPLPDD